ncbi:hypothetical protein [Pontibacter harenae]|uniref:hypothetical protein n=1 Tax=Pontibacter harenae TaxID=2894083 RepID=UPI001E45A229|nr:hypothetical protein [Pontibacter harenae]MCC9169146.1 hypothetical protein [Pontibacter harenae]
MKDKRRQLSLRGCLWACMPSQGLNRPCANPGVIRRPASTASAWRLFIFASGHTVWFGSRTFRGTDSGAQLLEQPAHLFHLPFHPVRFTGQEPALLWGQHGVGHDIVTVPQALYGLQPKHAAAHAQGVVAYKRLRRLIRRPVPYREELVWVHLSDLLVEWVVVDQVHISTFAHDPGLRTRSADGSGLAFALRCGLPLALVGVDAALGRAVDGPGLVCPEAARAVGAGSLVDDGVSGKLFPAVLGHRLRIWCKIARIT